MTTLRIAATSNPSQGRQSLRPQLQRRRIEFLEVDPDGQLDDATRIRMGLGDIVCKDRLEASDEEATILVIACSVDSVAPVIQILEANKATLLAVAMPQQRPSPHSTGLGATPKRPIVADTTGTLERLRATLDAHYRCYLRHSSHSRRNYDRAYRYGVVLEQSNLFCCSRWDDVAVPAKKGWETLTEGPWESFHSAVRFGWKLSRFAR